jgi:hypothetical protein
MSSTSKIPSKLLAPLNGMGGSVLPSAGVGPQAWAITAGAASRHGGQTNLLTRALTAFAVGRVEREFVVAQARQYFVEASAVNAVRLAEAASVTKRQIAADGARASAALNIVIQEVIDEFINTVTSRFSANTIMQAEQSHRSLRDLDRAVQEGRISPELAEKRRAAIEQMYDVALQAATIIVNDMLGQAVARIRRALAPAEEN